MAGKYLPTELQDSEGNVIYPHTETDVVWMQDGKSLNEFLESEVTDEQINAILNS